MTRCGVFINPSCASLVTGSEAVPVLVVLGDCAVAADVLTVLPGAVGTGLDVLAAEAVHVASLGFGGEGGEASEGNGSGEGEFGEVVHVCGWLVSFVCISSMTRCGVFIKSPCASSSTVLNGRQGRRRGREQVEFRSPHQ